MREASKKPINTIRQIQQISESHCGPAVVQMLLEAVGIFIDQSAIVRAASVETTIEAMGMRVDQMAKAVSELAPTLRFWYKYRADISDIQVILGRGYGVGVEWQGLFYESEDEEIEAEGEEYDDRGHYSIVVNVDEEYQELIFVDPHKQFTGRKRLFSLPTFMRRWWDVNEVEDPLTHQVKTIKDERMLFFITPAEETFPVDLGCKAFGVNI